MFSPSSKQQIIGLGFDVGMRNLGYAIVRYVKQLPECLDYRQEFHVEHLGLIDLGTLKTKDAVFELTKELDIRAHLFKNVDIVNIELQPLNGQTNIKCMSFALQMYFACRYPEKHLEFISARSKLTVYKGEEIVVPAHLTKYKQNKYKGIHQALKVLDTPQNLYWKSFVTHLEKKDDVCDAFLQCCYAVHRRYKEINTKKRPRGRPKSEPTLIIMDDDDGTTPTIDITDEDETPDQ